MIAARRTEFPSADYPRSGTATISVRRAARISARLHESRESSRVELQVRGEGRCAGSARNRGCRAQAARIAAAVGNGISAGAECALSATTPFLTAMPRLQAQMHVSPVPLTDHPSRASCNPRLSARSRRRL